MTKLGWRRRGFHLPPQPYPRQGPPHYRIEGHTDAVGNAGHNLLPWDRRAESVALTFSEHFGMPVENTVVQSRGEGALKILTQDAGRLNRRVAVRRITALAR